MRKNFFLGFIILLWSNICYSIVNAEEEKILDSGNDIPLSIDLKASWSKPPFVLEVIESIAAENPQAYFSTVTALTALLENKFSESTLLTDKEAHDLLIEHGLKTNLITESQTPYIDLSLAIHRYSALIQAQYQYFDIWSGIETPSSDCENILVYNGETRCDVDSVFALKTVSGSETNSKIELLPTDRTIGNDSDAPIAILYGDLESESFGIFHSNLISSALQGKVQYILRYKSKNGSNQSTIKENLTGYGVALNVKRTDYLVIDDRDSEGANGEKSSSAENKDSYSELRAATDKSILNKDDIPLLGFRAANYILTNNNPFEALLNVTLDFPKYSKSISELASSKKVARDVKYNVENEFLSSGQNAILINGSPAFGSHDSSFELLDALDRERIIVDKMVSTLGFKNPSVAADLINRNVIGAALENHPLQRYDYRTDGLIWLNDIEDDLRYRSWTSDVTGFLEPLTSVGQLHPVKHNMNSFVFALDLSYLGGTGALSAFTQAMNLVARGIPIQVGIVPLIYDQDGEDIARHLSYLSKYALSTDPTVIQTYLGGILSQYDPITSFRQALSIDDKPTLKAIESDLEENAEIQSVIENLRLWMKNFDLPADRNRNVQQPLIFVNGILLDEVNSLLLEASAVFRRDLESIQQSIRAGEYDSSSSAPIRDFLIKDGIKRRNSLVNPPDSSMIEYMDISSLVESLVEHGLSPIPSVSVRGNTESDSDYYTTIWLVGNFSEKDTLQQLAEVLKLLDSEESQGRNLRVNIIPSNFSTASTTNDNGDDVNIRDGSNIVSLFSKLSGMAKESERITMIRRFLQPYTDIQSMVNLAAKFGNEDKGKKVIGEFSNVLQKFPTLNKGLHLIVSGRIVDIPVNSVLDQDDLTMLLEIEQKTRINPIIEAAKGVYDYKNG